MDMEYLRRNEEAQEKERRKQAKSLEEMEANKAQIQKQIEATEQLREQARCEYEREREQVDKVVQRMIEEDNEM